MIVYMNKRVLQPKEVMAQLLLDLYEKYPNATKSEYANMLGISQNHINQLTKKMFNRDW
ncbi:hypothetical protein D3C74_310530 [compost metagenome]